MTVPVRWFPSGVGVECGDREVLHEVVVSANHAKDNEVALGADGGGKAGDDVDLAEGVDVTVVEEDVARSS